MCGLPRWWWQEVKAAIVVLVATGCSSEDLLPTSVAQANPDRRAYVQTCEEVFDRVNDPSAGISPGSVRTLCRRGTPCTGVRDCQFRSFGHCVGHAFAYLSLEPVSCEDGECIYEAKVAGGNPDGVCCEHDDQVWFVCIGRAPGPDCVCR